ncbi:MAG: VWA domain-containing protein [Pyrinomonadaceae bacterium]|nr:VWA domain-containing protein [Pyrinomonadaceae bacterium]
MSFPLAKAPRLVAVSLVFLTTIAGVLAQQPQKPVDDSEVVRISTELAQTGVVVLDKQGRFVDGLTPEQFQLRVDGKPVTPAFIEHVIAGTVKEEKLESAVARGLPATNVAAAPVSSSYRGRTIIFFIDDLHLSAESVVQTRKAILDFVENQMGTDDHVAIASPSGQLGFLQKFTDLKPVLRAAIARLTYRNYAARDVENASMTEYTALKIEQGDRDALSFFTEELLKASNFRSAGGPLGPSSPSPFGGKSSARPNSSGMSREMAERQIKERAQILLKQSASVTVSTLATLESLMRSSSQMAGRKLVFFVSDGFYLNDRNTAFGDKLKQITDAAVRAGVVIYTLDARGLVSMTDASSNLADPQGRLARANIGELSASQDALSALAADTGGRALLNSGALTTAVNNALKETSNYYLLAWRPPVEEQKGGNFKRLEVSIANRPELTVRLPRGFLVSEPRAAAKSGEAATPNPESPLPNAGNAKGPDAALMAALAAPSARKGLPTQLSVSFIDVPGTGPVLTVSTQMATNVLGYGADGKQPAAIAVAGIVQNDQGKQAGGYMNRVTVNPSANTEGQHPSVTYSHRIPLKPGIYLIRVAAKDDKSGRVGSAVKWIEIPDLASKKLTLSSLLVGGQFVGATQQQTSAGGAADQMQFSVDRRFARGSHLSVLTMIYNAARSTGAAVPDLEAQIKILRGGQPVMSSPVRKLNLEAGADVARIPYGADIKLNTLTPGRYLLRIEINDRVANTSASQETVFEVE